MSEERLDRAALEARLDAFSGALGVSGLSSLAKSSYESNASRFVPGWRGTTSHATHRPPDWNGRPVPGS